jgi:hypothetical protein
MFSSFSTGAAWAEAARLTRPQTMIVRQLDLAAFPQGSSPRPATVERRVGSRLERALVGTE